MREDESLLIQSGKPVGVFRTHVDAPRVLIANSNLVPKWATWEHFDELDAKGLMMFGQMTAGSWIYIGSQGIVQGTYETFVEAGRQHYGGKLAGRWILTAGLGGMGGAQPLAASFAGASSLNIECQQDRIEFRLRTRYLDEQARDLDDALARIATYTSQGVAKSIGLLGNAADLVPEIARRAAAGGPRPDLVTDQTSAHDLVNGYLPSGWPVERWRAARGDPSQHAALREAAANSCAVHVQAMLQLQAMGIPTVDYGNNIRQVALDAGVKNAFDIPGIRPGVHPAAVLPRQGAFPVGRAVRRSGGHLQDRSQAEGTVSGRPAPQSLARPRARSHRVPGPARAHLLAGLGRTPSRGPRVQRDGAQRRVEGTDRHRSRSSGQRLGRLAEPRDRSACATAPTRSRTGRC